MCDQMLQRSRRVRRHLAEASDGNALPSRPGRDRRVESRTVGQHLALAGMSSCPPFGRSQVNPGKQQTRGFASRTRRASSSSLAKSKSFGPRHAGVGNPARGSSRRRTHPCRLRRIGERTSSPEHTSRRPASCTGRHRRRRPACLDEAAPPMGTRDCARPDDPRRGLRADSQRRPCRRETKAAIDECASLKCHRGAIRR